MKKYILLPFLSLALSATSLFAQTTVTETFPNVPSNSPTSPTTLAGDYSSYAYLQARRSSTDLFTDNAPAIWIQTSATQEGYVKGVQTIEGGAKNISFEWSRFGSLTNQELKLVLYMNETEITAVGGQGSFITDKEKQVETVSEANVKANFTMEFRNESFIVSGSTLNARAYLGNVTWTPYIFYTQKSDEVQAGTSKINTGFINNIEANDGLTLSYSSSNTAIAEVDALTGEVTGLAEGDVTITASATDDTSTLTATYELHVTPAKPYPTASFATNTVDKQKTDEAFINAFTTNSDGAVTYTSSNPACATVNSTTGEVTIVANGTALVTAASDETANYQALSVSYKLYVGWIHETFDGAASGNTYNATETTSTSTATGISWSALLGSISNGLQFYINNDNDQPAAVIRGKKVSEADYGYIKSSTISDGIDSLTFEWNVNGSEIGRTLDIDIFVNETLAGHIGDADMTVINSNNTTPEIPYNRFSAGDLEISGDFILKFVNKSEYDATGNQYRFVFDNVEWMKYSGLTTSAPSNAINPMKIYPNPATDRIYISNAAGQRARIGDISGKTLLETQITASGIDVSAFAAGVYIVKAGDKVSKLVIK